MNEPLFLNTNSFSLPQQFNNAAGPTVLPLCLLLAFQKLTLVKGTNSTAVERKEREGEWLLLCRFKQKLNRTWRIRPVPRYCYQRFGRGKRNNDVCSLLNKHYANRDVAEECVSSMRFAELCRWNKREREKGGGGSRASGFRCGHDWLFMSTQQGVHDIEKRVRGGSQNKRVVQSCDNGMSSNSSSSSSSTCNCNM